VVNADAIEPDEFPLIGEPLPVEFANSLYVSEGEEIDFLATPKLIQMWFQLAGANAGLPTRIRRADGDAVRELRDAVRSVLSDLADTTTPADREVLVLNRYAGRAPWSVQLNWNDGRPTVSEQRTCTAIDAALGRIASQTIALVGGPTRLLLRRCNGPGCPMLFVKDHHKRRWCHHSCGHRARQASYYRRKKAVAAHRT
jgi:predicted RNA-binding Zn ribbon-like protein